MVKQMQNLNARPIDPALQTERIKRTEAEKALEKARKRFQELRQRENERTTELLSANRRLKQEIDDRNRVEKKLRDSEERYRALFENNPVETVIVDSEARVIGYNLAKRQSDGRLPEIGDVMYKDYAGKHDINMLDELKACIRSGATKEFPEQRYKARFLHIRISPFPGGFHFLCMVQLLFKVLFFLLSLMPLGDVRDNRAKSRDDALLIPLVIKVRLNLDKTPPFCQAFILIGGRRLPFSSHIL